MKPKFEKLNDFPSFELSEMIKRSKEYFDFMNKRRTVRTYSPKKIPIAIIENAIKTAGTAPSGANMQPWHFAIVIDSDIKRQIRIEAEKEEKEFYNTRAPKEWLDALRQFGTNEKKPFLETVPYLIVVFEKKHEVNADGSKIKHYYTKESVGIATGMLISALHNAGVATLTHTPSPMNFLSKILKRPDNEKPYLIVVAGFPDENTKVPKINRKKLSEIATFY